MQITMWQNVSEVTHFEVDCVDCCFLFVNADLAAKNDFGENLIMVAVYPTGK